MRAASLRDGDGLSDRGTVESALGGNPPVRGHEAIHAVVDGFFHSGLLRSMHHELVAAWEQDAALIYQARVHYELNDGRALDLPYVNVIRFAGELVVDYRVFIDLTPLAPPAPGPGSGHGLPVVVRFEVTPERQRDLADAIYEFNMDHVREQDGFVETNLYLSADGKQVINFGRWRDAAAYAAFLAKAPSTVPALLREFPFDSRAHSLAFRVTPGGSSTEA